MQVIAEHPEARASGREQHHITRPSSLRGSLNRLFESQTIDQLDPRRRQRCAQAICILTDQQDGASVPSHGLRKRLE